MSRDRSWLYLCQQINITAQKSWKMLLLLLRGRELESCSGEGRQAQERLEGTSIHIKRTVFQYKKTQFVLFRIPEACQLRWQRLLLMLLGCAL